jgi:mono/diheme cytochrome c family protein
MKIKAVSSIGSAVLMLTIFAPALAMAQSTVKPKSIDQGPNWTPADQKDFYSRDQGSDIMPLRWMAALKQPNGESFMAASLSRYGYLANEASKPPGLPVGFTVAAGKEGGQRIGMTCAACHTRQIEVGGVAYRIDGGPAIVDAQSFFADMDVAMNAVLSNEPAFANFVAAVLGPKPSPAEKAQLRKEVERWYLRNHTLVKGALPSPAWGPGRVDAVGMIFNRLAGLDIGPAPSHLIPENIRPAAAPARYPFLWNSPVQSKTQWPGFADNGNEILALSRNLGEVYGVFAVFFPKKDSGRLLGIDYLAENSANFQGLNALEELVKKIGPPKWPWTIDQKLAAQGQEIFGRSSEHGGCVQCHGITPGPTRFFDQKTWNTRVVDVGTDSREFKMLGWTVKTGVLNGAEIPLLKKRLKPVDTAINVLGTAVIGSIIQNYVPFGLQPEEQKDLQRAIPPRFSPEIESLRGDFQEPQKTGAPAIAYESRVLEGIWAAAPYLHNGSVPTLTELLKPAAERVQAFKIGPAYDPVNVGLAVEQTKFDYTLQTTDCNERDSGNSRCGHEFGTTLPPEEKKALVEYLKTL